MLARDGYALVTVPCGVEEDRGWFVQHDREGWNRLFAATRAGAEQPSCSAAQVRRGCLGHARVPRVNA